MYVHDKLSKLNDYFVELDKRPQKCVFFYRINGYSASIADFLAKYYEIASKSGIVIEGKLSNPEQSNLSYYEDVMGMEFRGDVNFISESLKKWLPEINFRQREDISNAIFEVLDELKQSGKNDNILKNAYIKFMCWLYYKFERILSRLGDNDVPKILYEGDISIYELMMLRILSGSGCDVVLLQYKGDDNYLKIDSDSRFSESYNDENTAPFPEAFSIGKPKKEALTYNCTNAWITGKGIEDIKTSLALRGSDKKLFYNCFYRINGVWDKNTYINDIYLMYNELRQANRKVVVVDGDMEKPSNEEIAGIKRGRYSKEEDMLNDIASNLRYGGNTELNKIMNNAFMEVMLDEAGAADMNLNRLTVRAVYVVCWMKRYMSNLFEGWRMPNVSCFIHMGAVNDEAEGVFLRFLARLPVDVVILCPNLNDKCIVSDKLLYELNEGESMSLMPFPQENTAIQMGTAAYQAERELDTLLYRDSGMYRNMQYGKATSITLKTMYEEIAILWNQELKYRPNFSTDNEKVMMPVIFAKVSGVKNGDINKYWNGVGGLITPETLVIRHVPYLTNTTPNPIKPYATDFYRDGRVLKNKIKENACYQYGVLREEMQEHILDKIQLLIDQRTIKGTGENGTEYTIISTALNMSKEIVRVIQKFDFTKVNPKLIYINTGENIISLEDSILTALLNLIGFDVVFFVPTGYQSIEKYFNNKLIEEHQMGNFVYDLAIPDLSVASSNNRKSLRDRLFRKGV
jgi:hypothetical protein